MKLEEQFKKYNYKSLLQKEIAKMFQFDISYFLNEEKQKPAELCDIYISSQGDEIFILLFGDGRDIHTLCEEWDNKVSVFTAFGSDNRKALRKIKYNVIEIILCKDKNADYTEEGSLNITRKLIIPYDIAEDGSILISDEEMIEIPFYMIPSSDFLVNEEKIKALKKCMPEENLEILFQENKKSRGKKETFEKKDYAKIEEWLKNVYQECKNN